MNGFGIAFIVIISMRVGVNIIMDGKPRTDRYSFWAYMAATSIDIGILYGAGTFG